MIVVFGFMPNHFRFDWELTIAEEWNNNYLIKMIQIPKRKTSRFQSVFNQDIKLRNQLQ